MMVGFEDTTEDKKWLVSEKNKNIQCFFSDGNKSEHQDECLGTRMLTSSIGASETQLTLNKHCQCSYELLSCELWHWQYLLMFHHKIALKRIFWLNLKENIARVWLIISKGNGRVWVSCHIIFRKKDSLREPKILCLVVLISIFASGQKMILLQSWIDRRMSSVIPSDPHTQFFLQTTINIQMMNICGIIDFYNNTKECFVNCQYMMVLQSELCEFVNKKALWLFQVKICNN